MKKRISCKLKERIVMTVAALLILATICIGVVFAVGEESVTVRIEFSDGTYGAENTDTELFQDFYKDRGSTSAGTLILPDKTFAENIGSATLSFAKKLDNETFYFNNAANPDVTEATTAGGDSSDPSDDYANMWSYTFVGWKVVSDKDGNAVTDKIPGQTVFQPGDVITLDALEKYVSSTEMPSLKVLKLEALWAKCYFVRNPYNNMEYEQTLSVKDKAGNTVSEKIFVLKIPQGVTPLSSDGNRGNDPEKPKATIDGIYSDIRSELGATYVEQRENELVHDAYSRAVVLVGDLDYYTDSSHPETKYYGYELQYNAETGNAIQYPTANNIVPVAATYKSLGDTAYTYNYKPRKYSNTVFGNMRFDNVNFCSKKDKWSTQDNGVEFQISHDSRFTPENSYIEFTARYNANMPSGRKTAISTFRPNDVTYVVVNGGTFSGMQNQYSSGVSTGKQLYWTIGRKAKFDNLNCGTTTAYNTAYQNVYYNYKVYVLGGTVTNIYGGNNGLNTISAGKREFFLYGAARGTSEYNPDIENLYGGASESRLYGDISIEAYYCTDIKNVYGGGRDYSAATFGNIYLELVGCEISGDVYGGGKFGNCERTPSTYIQYVDDTASGEKAPKGIEKPIADLDTAFNGNISIDGRNISGRNTDNIGGDVTVKLQGTKVKGNVFGSGMGQTQILEVRNQMQAEVNDWWLNTELIGDNGYIDDISENVVPKDDDTWRSPIQGYPSYSKAGDNRVLVNAWRDGTYTTNAAEIVSFYNFQALASLSLATVQNVTITITDQSVIGESGTSGKGNVYGGGSIAKVLGNTNITITNSTVYGDVYGGGDGVTRPDQVKVYWPEDNAKYAVGGELYDPSLPAYVSPYYTGKKGDITWVKQTPDPEGRKKTNTENKGNYKQYKLYSWSNESYLIDASREDYGIDHDALLLYSPNTEGLGSVNGNTSVTINGSSYMFGNVYGGGNQGIVLGNTNVTIAGETVIGDWEQKDVELVDGTKVKKWVCVSETGESQVFGGGNGDSSKDQTDQLGVVYGNTNLTIDESCLIHEAYGGCNAADVKGSANLTIQGGTVDYGFGGNNIKGSIEGAVNTTLTDDGSVIHQLFGGGNKADYAGVTNLVISGGKVGILDTPQSSTGTVVGCAFGGGKEASVEGAETTISGGELRAFVGGSLRADINADVDGNGTTDDDAITVYITGEKPTKITTFMGGNDMGGVVTGNIRIVMGLSKENLFEKDGGGNPTGKINYKGACDNDNIEITNFFGGGNIAEYSFGADWELPTDIPSHDAPVAGYQGITITAAGGTVYQMFGGGVMANITNVRTAIYGGEYNFIYGGGFRGSARSCATHLRGGIISGEWLAYEKEEDLPTSTQGGYIFGGGYEGYTEHTVIHVEEHDESYPLIINHSVFAGGNKAGVGSSKVLVSAGEIIGSVYGGGYVGAAGVNADGSPNSEYETAVNIYGGDIGAGQSAGSGSTATYLYGNVYGGGYKGTAYETHVDIAAYEHSQKTTELKLYGNVYGGGHEADVTGNTHIHFITGHIDGNVYGGGREGDVVSTGETDFSGAPMYGNTYVDILAGTVGGNVYGGGYLGTVNRTHVLISDKPDVIAEIDNGKLFSVYNAALNAPGTDQTVVLGKLEGGTATGGNVFGGGHGMTAHVLDKAIVRIDLEYNFTVTETKVDTTETTSGEVKSVLTEVGEGPYSVIHGNVFGGGDLGQVGQGTINPQNQSGNATKPGETEVTVNSGKIGGSVFGGGRGVPESGMSYSTAMGTVFGKTRTYIYGGYIYGNVYGGGMQSRLYADTSSTEPVALVSINEKVNEDASIAIGGSTFGGGDRGDEHTMNATIPTTYGNVEVNIIGRGESQASQIYFLGHGGKGGIYGDGNLCLVKGTRTINIKDFNVGEASGRGLKTFYSLQRADSVTLDNSEVVLLGAVDLVAEGDSAVYSINRVGALYMKNGSIFKLDQVVKSLLYLESDIDTDRVFIDKGNNGKNTYLTHGGLTPSGMLNETNDLTAYHTGTYLDSKGNPVTDDRKNVVCVANGRYLEVYDEDNKKYGAVKGLFTLELLHAIPGEGGGYVYADIATSTGDFICETKRGYHYEAQTGLTLAQFTEGIAAGKKYFVRESTGKYVNITAYQNNTIIYEGQASDDYMKVVDDVGGYVKNATSPYYTYYFWYISGPIISYEGNITGYIGAVETQFSDSKTVPSHEGIELAYALFGVSGNTTLLNAITGTYDLVTSRELTGQQIALELILGENSLGFIYYDTVQNKWGIKKTDGSTVFGYGGITDRVHENELIEQDVDPENNTLYIVLHKSVEVNAEVPDMNVNVVLDLFREGNPYPDGASTLIFNIDVSIVRLNPKQKVFTDSYKGYTGVSSLNPIHITGQSAFTVQYFTEYIPGAFPRVNGKAMDWYLSAKEYRYYMDEGLNGYFLTIDSAGNIINKSHEYDGEQTHETAGANMIYKAADGNYYYKPGDSSPSHKLVEQFFSPSTGTTAGSSKASVFIVNTKITMIDLSNINDPQYYYYVVKTQTDEIDIRQFMVMGTTVTIQELIDDEIPSNEPTFMKFYETQAFVRQNENLVFIVDLVDVKWENVDSAIQSKYASGVNLTLRHTYDGKDIMDYAESDENSDSSSGRFARYSPLPADYMVNDDKHGLNENECKAAFEVSSEYKASTPTYYDLDTSILNFKIVRDDYWVNTLFDDDELSLKVELIGADENPVKLPVGIKFIFNGEVCPIEYNGMYAVIPLGEIPSDTSEVNYRIVVENLLYSMIDAVGGNTARFRLTLYSAPAADYYNSHDKVSEITASYNLAPNPAYSVSATAEIRNRIFASGKKLTVKLDWRLDGEELEKVPSKVQILLQKKNVNGKYDNLAWDQLFETPQGELKIGNNTYNIKTDSSFGGTYRLYVNYGDRQEYWYFIIGA